MKRFNILVGVIPTFDGKLLLTRRSLLEKFLPGAWGLPCGKIDFGESLEDAVDRELMEETGLSVGTSKELVGYSMFMSTKDGDELHNLQINYLVEVRAAEPVRLDRSNDAYKWVTFDECQSADLDAFTLSTIRQAFDRKKSI